MKRRERNLDGNGHHDMLQRNGTNNTTAFDTAMEQNDNVFPHYESIYENEIVEMSHPTTSVNLSNLPCASSKKNVEDTNIQILNKKRVTKGENTLSKTRKNFKRPLSYSSEQSDKISIPEGDKKAYAHPNQYLSLNVNEMEYLNSYSTPMTNTNY